jgi:ubiquinone/menaquinone biosynthesis C-methylase UbiE
MDDLQLLMELHGAQYRQGPGSDAATERAIDLAGLDRDAPLAIADIGCGTGASTLCLAQQLNAVITAVDFLQPFLDTLQQRAREQGLAEWITTSCASMEALPFDEASFDVIWAEGAIYNIGFERGVREWRRFLKPGGLLVVSEITWTTAVRPAALQQHWAREYPEVDLASAKFAELERHGYAPAGYFTLPDDCWQEHFYQPLSASFEAFLARHGNSDAARAIVEAERAEIALYEQYSAYFNYGVYLARKVAG